MHWNLANFLPAPVREPFAAAVAGFLSAAYSQPKELPALLRGEISQKLFQYVHYSYCLFTIVISVLNVKYGCLSYPKVLG